jgi:hypothetical protein
MIRFRRSFKILPGIRLHVGLRGIGICAGTRGLHVGLHAQTGRPYISAGIPGTGFYAQKPLGQK